MDLSIGLGLVAAFCWGTSDYVAKLSTGKIGYLRTALFLQYVGEGVLLLLTFRDFSLFWIYPRATLVAVLLGLLNVGATLSLFKGFEVGKLSVVSPISSSYPAFSTILAVWFLGESVSGPVLVGILAILLGIILVSSQHTEQTTERRQAIGAGVGYALSAFFFMGLLFFGLKIIVGELGSYLPVLILRTVTALILTILFIVRGHHSAPLTSHTLMLIGFIGVVDTLANLSYTVGVSLGTVPVVSTVSGLFSAVSVILAYILLREKISAHQMAGFVAILVGIGIVGYLT